ncbi:hypothetical protein LCGC14_2135820, partial [marine sediment metagenome]
MNRQEALELLKDADHAIFYPHVGHEIARAFGVEAPVRSFAVGINRVTTLKGGEGYGVDAAELACKIADS